MRDKIEADPGPWIADAARPTIAGEFTVRLPVRRSRFPDPRDQFPVRLSKFPVPISRELSAKPRQSLGNPGLKIPDKPEFDKIPCIFPCYQGIRHLRRVRRRLGAPPSSPASDTAQCSTPLTCGGAKRLRRALSVRRVDDLRLSLRPSPEPESRAEKPLDHDRLAAPIGPCRLVHRRIGSLSETQLTVVKCITCNFNVANALTSRQNPSRRHFQLAKASCRLRRGKNAAQ